MKKLLALFLALMCFMGFALAEGAEETSVESMDDAVFADYALERLEAFDDQALIDFYTRVYELCVERFSTPSPDVTIVMESGDEIHLELYPDIAPNTVANFVQLAQEGFYDGVIFHRVISGFMIQGGDPEGTGMGGPGFTIKGEFTANGVQNNISHERGVISMARRGSGAGGNNKGYDTAGSQFFIMHVDYPALDGQYAAFGRVTDEASMAVVDAIAATATDASDKPLTDQRIKTIIVDTHGVDYSAERIYN